MGTLPDPLLEASRSGVYRAARADELLAAARARRLDLARIDLEGAAAKDALLERVAAALAFPAWFGRNWDALEDCLCDLSWRPPTAHLLVFERGAGLRASAPDDWAVLRDILESCAAHWAARGTGFFAVFVEPGADLELPALPAAGAR